MFIKFNKNMYDLGTPVSIEITYDNQTDDVIVIPDPSKSLDVLMRAVDMKTNEEMNYTMGKIIVTEIDRASGQFAISEPPVSKIEIKPGLPFVTTSDLNEKLYLHPGKFDCSLKDKSEESNHVQVTIKFTKTSVDYLFGLAKDIDHTYGRREWAMEWLQKLYPDFKLNLPLEDDTSSIKTQKEASNKLVYDHFSEWWNNNKATKNMELL